MPLDRSSPDLPDDLLTELLVNQRLLQERIEALEHAMAEHRAQVANLRQMILSLAELLVAQRESPP